MKKATTMTRDQFDQIRQLLEGARQSTRPRLLDLYDVFSAVLHHDSVGGGWRTLPAGSPPWRSVHNYWTIWTTTYTEDGSTLLAAAYKQLGIKP